MINKIIEDISTHININHPGEMSPTDSDFVNGNGNLTDYKVTFQKSYGTPLPGISYVLGKPYDVAGSGMCYSVSKDNSMHVSPFIIVDGTKALQTVCAECILSANDIKLIAGNEIKQISLQFSYRLTDFEGDKNPFGIQTGSSFTNLAQNTNFNPDSGDSESESESEDPDVPTQQYTITVNCNEPKFGSVSGGGTFNDGTSHVITATPIQGYQFNYWQIDDKSYPYNPYTITLNGNNITATAYFAVKQNDPIPTVENKTLMLNVPIEGGSIIVD